MSEKTIKKTKKIVSNSDFDITLKKIKFDHDNVCVSRGLTETSRKKQIEPSAKTFVTNIFFVINQPLYKVQVLILLI